MMADSSVHSNEINTYIVKILNTGSLAPLIGSRYGLLRSNIFWG